MYVHFLGVYIVTKLIITTMIFVDYYAGTVTYLLGPRSGSDIEIRAFEKLVR